MTVNIQQYEYVTQAGDTAGIVVGILPQNQMPFPEDDGVIISPGHATSIAIVQVREILTPASVLFVLLLRSQWEVQSIVMSVSVCLSVCLSVSPSVRWGCRFARISQEPQVQTSPNFCACCLWTWLCHPLVAL